MKELLEFISFQDANIRFVVFGLILLSTASASVGTFAMLRKRSLIGDAVAHAVLPGICLAFMFTGEKNPLVLLIGSFISGSLSVYCIDLISRNTKIKADTAVAMVLSVFFGLGIVLLTHIQHSDYANQAGLDKFLFGKAASMTQEDVYVFGGVALLVLIILLLFLKEFKLLSFDSKYAKTIGYSTKWLEMLLSSLTVLAVITGIQAVGVVLMAAMLITPAVGAKFWSNNLNKLIIIAVFFAIFSALTGSFISYSETSMPTGPWIVVIISGFAMVSFLVAPQKGLLSIYVKQIQHKRKIAEENLLKRFYQLGEKEQDFYHARSLKELQNQSNYLDLKLSLSLLLKHRFIEKTGKAYQLSKAGYAKGQRITRAHRLWESYLSEHLNIPADHVHDNAETVEHIITPDLEIEIRNSLSNPDLDPHQSQIPKKDGTI